MPLYEYSPTSGDCDRCNGLFSVMQRLADEKLTRCPTCAQPCERRISAVALGGRWSPTNSRIEDAGFTKYKRAGNGVYERVAGKNGPKELIRGKG